MVKGFLHIDAGLAAGKTISIIQQYRSHAYRAADSTVFYSIRVK